jgi:hypothetical protein
VRTCELPCNRDVEVVKSLGASGGSSESVTRQRYKAEARYHVVAPSRACLQPLAAASGAAASVLREVARRRIVSPPLVQATCGGTNCRHGLPQVCGCFGNFKRAGIWLHVWRSGGSQRLHLDIAQRHKASMARGSACVWKVAS